MVLPGVQKDHFYRSIFDIYWPVNRSILNTPYMLTPRGAIWTSHSRTFRSEV